MMTAILTELSSLSLDDVLDVAIYTVKQLLHCYLCNHTWLHCGQYQNIYSTFVRVSLLNHTHVYYDSKLNART